MKNKMQFVSRKRRFFRLPLRHFLGNRNIKDRLFCYIFEQDRKALLQLYNTLNHTDYQDEQKLQIVTLDNVVYMSMNNDVAFLLLGTLSLYEHQSTLCPNLPLRFLLYIAAEYEGLVTKAGENIYGKAQIPLPAPQCVVFYNGEEEIEDEQDLRLTDAFTGGDEKENISCVELTVRVLNVNHGHNRQLMSACSRMEEYSRFVDCIKKYNRCGLSADQAIENAVVFCIEHGIMDDILLPFRAEVKKMLLTEYNEKKYMKMFRKEARKEGLEEGLKEGMKEGIKVGINRMLNNMLQNGASPEEIARLTGVSSSEIEEVQKKRQALQKS